MVDYSFTKEAAADFDSIYEYSVLNFGVQKARKYAEQLEECLQDLAITPNKGKCCDDIKVGIRRIFYESHTIYYLETDTSILVLRILHQRMDPARHL